jgi:hypothetical protein
MFENQNELSNTKKFSQSGQLEHKLLIFVILPKILLSWKVTSGNILKNIGIPWSWSIFDNIIIRLNCALPSCQVERLVFTAYRGL